ncbi:OmpP1/FadL family transporter [Novispirillum sp. DQ9]|uniref:OmpP1/FadL family transporter n=1 Tax=Novispirillum sp. DQ9 TaxID=3398612 RepID=UPI003C79B1D9
MTMPMPARRPVATAPVVAAAALVAAGVAFAAPAWATNGYFSHGQGPKSQGMAGAGTAMEVSPIASAMNPALGQKAGNIAGGCAEVFMPERDATLGGTKYESDNTFFAIPCAGVNTRLDDRSSLGLTLIGNGGMNTDYDPIPAFGTSGAGVDLAQAMIGINYAREVGGGLSLGVMPMLAYQRFKATGLENFTGPAGTPFQRSLSPDRVTNNGYDGSWGYGVRLGALWEVNDMVSFGAAYKSRTYMTRFDKYEGLFAERGDFDIPPSVRAGVAVKPVPEVTVALDYERIFYGDVKSISNTGAAGQGGCFTSPGALLGTDEGCGFGWQDMDVWRIGVEWQATPQLALRTGYSVNSGFADGQEVAFNILAPATIKQHASVGLTYAFNPTWGLSAAYTRAFSESLSGNSPTLGGAPVTLRMDQHIGSVGVSYRW